MALLGCALKLAVMVVFMFHFFLMMPSSKNHGGFCFLVL